MPASGATLAPPMPGAPAIAESSPPPSPAPDVPETVDIPAPSQPESTREPLLPLPPQAAAPDAPSAPSQSPTPSPSVAAIPHIAAPTPLASTPSAGVAIGPPPSTAKGGEAFRECEDCPEMVVAPSGRALLGSLRGEPGRDDRSEFNPYEVEFVKPFAIGRYDVTFGEWDACVADGGCGARRPGDMDFGRGRRPVIFVSWNDAQSYIAWLKGKTHQAYRLPSEAEWEYAARGCARLDCEPKPFWFGPITPENAVYDWRFSYLNSPKAFDVRQQTEPVDRGSPNPFGLFNILGDVRQWTLDCWLLPPPAPPHDGAPLLTGDCSERVTRGGSWKEKPAALRAAARSWGSATDRTQPNVGFRVARDLLQ